MHNNFVIRKATRDDIDVMVGMQMDMAWETERLHLDYATVKRGITMPFERDNIADFYVVEEEGENKIVAMLMTTQEWSDWRAGSVLWIQSVFVRSDYRRRGLFAKMYAYLKHMVETSDNYQGLRLYVEKENANAMATYKKLGMEVEHYHMMKWMKSGF